MTDRKRDVANDLLPDIDQFGEDIQIEILPDGRFRIFKPFTLIPEIPDGSVRQKDR